jgi:hypothetical protein
MGMAWARLMQALLLLGLLVGRRQCAKGSTRVADGTKGPHSAVAHKLRRGGSTVHAGRRLAVAPLFLELLSRGSPYLAAIPLAHAASLFSPHPSLLGLPAFAYTP